ncbi:MAG: universal stress protein [Desulfatitalea sp.]|nr:universal stress protein [Desulfatitalea sp.]NNK01879.1 universal stress protein [Desulfatitalea sp.]
MQTIQRILFPVDLTESSDKLVPYVLTMANKFDAQVHILFVVRMFHYFTDIYVAPPSISVFETELVEGARKKMEEFTRTHFSALPRTRAEVVLGDPPEAILTHIVENQTDMVIMGTHGRKGLDRVLFGSVAERVIKTAKVPVLVVNPHAKENERAGATRKA